VTDDVIDVADIDAKLWPVIESLAAGRKQIPPAKVLALANASYPFGDVIDSIRRWRATRALGKVVAFRVTSSDFDEYQGKFSASGLSQSEFFRRYVLTNATQVIARPRSSVDKDRLLYLFGSASNNLNQLAHRAHLDNLASNLSEQTYQALLDQLQQISRSLKAALPHVD
jgi:hypothetical protein